MDKVRKEMLAALQKEGEWADALVALVARDHAKDDDFKLEEFLPAMPDKELSKAWEAISARLAPLVGLVTSSSEEEEGEEAVPPQDQEEVCAAFRMLQAVVTLAQGTLNAIKKATGLPAGLLQAMVALHDALFLLTGVDGEALQAGIVKVCEQWWREERGGAEHLVAQTVPYLVARSLEEDAREALVKRVYAMRGALLLLDYEEEATGPFRALLLQCFLKPTYLRSADGRRMLTYLFGLHPALVADIHETVKAQLPHAGRRLVQSYGDVYFRAWKAATGPYLEAIEQDCVQDLMQSAVNCASPALYASLRLFLQAFHSNKRLREVDAMLLRLYNPIIWRSLQVANPVVRAQATGLLIDAFPLQDPTMGTVEAAALLQKQLDMLQAVLVDPDPHVRVAGVCGVCRVMAAFWEAIPLGVTKAYITRLVGSLAFDSASALVRLAVVDGLRELLEQPLAHPVLKQALPLAAPLLHDKTPRVRAAFVGLLQRVKALGVRDIRFYEVVPVEQLLARFAADAEKPSARALVNRMADLLLNSYFPQGQGVTGSKQVSRCLTLLSQSKPAALAFYSRLREHVGLGPVARLIAMLLKCVFAALADQEAAAKTTGGKTSRPERKRKGKAASSSADTEEEEDSDERDEAAADGAKQQAVQMSAADRETLSGILEVVAALWASVQGELGEERHKAAADMLKETLAGEDMAGLYERLGCASPCLLQLAALCPELFASALGPPMARDLREGTLGQGADADHRAGPIAALLCLWGRTREVVNLIAGGLEALAVAATGSEPAAPPSTAAGAPVGKRKRAAGLDAELAAVGVLPPQRALAMLAHLLSAGQGDATAQARALVLAEEAEGEGRIRAALGAVRAAAAARVRGEAQPATGTTTALMVIALELYLRLELHLWGTSALLAHEQDDDGDDDQEEGLPQTMEALLAFVGEELLPAALHMPPAAAAASSSQSSSSSSEEVDGQEQEEDGIACSPAPRKARTGRGASQKQKKQQQTEAACAQLALEMSAAALTVLADWVAMAPPAAVRVAAAAEGWAQQLLLPALAADGDDDGDSDEDVGTRRERRYAALALLPQVCRLVYQLALQEAKHQQQQGDDGGARLPAPLLEVVVRVLDFKPDSQDWHRYQDSGVDGAKCLQALLALYARLRSHRARLSALVERLTAFCLQELGENQQEEMPPSPLLTAVCAALAKSTPTLNAAMTLTLTQLRATVTATATAAVTGAGVEAAAEMDDPAAAQANLELRARLLASLFGAAAPKVQAALLPKLARSVGAAAEDAEQAKAAAADREEEGDAAALDALGKAAATLEGLEAKLRQLAVAADAAGPKGGEAMVVESC